MRSSIPLRNDSKLRQVGVAADAEGVDFQITGLVNGRLFPMIWLNNFRQDWCDAGM
jgi:hypothetical protein